MKTLFQITGLIALVFIFGACKTTSSSVANQPEGITEKYWKLIEITGKPVALDASGREPHIILLYASGGQRCGQGSAT
jgi:heat shock protein HslJ